MRRIPHSLFLAFCLLSSLQLSLCCRSLSVLRTCSLRSTRPDLTMCPFVPVLGVAGRGMWAAVQLYSYYSTRRTIYCCFLTQLSGVFSCTHTHTHVYFDSAPSVGVVCRGHFWRLLTLSDSPASHLFLPLSLTHQFVSASTCTPPSKLVTHSTLKTCRDPVFVHYNLVLLNWDY